MTVDPNEVCQPALDAFNNATRARENNQFAYDEAVERARQAQEDMINDCAAANDLFEEKLEEAIQQAHDNPLPEVVVTPSFLEKLTQSLLGGGIFGQLNCLRRAAQALSAQKALDRARAQHQNLEEAERRTERNYKRCLRAQSFVKARR